MPRRLLHALPVRPLANIQFRAGSHPRSANPPDVTRPGPWASHRADENHIFWLSAAHVVTLTLRFEIAPAGRRPGRTITLERRIGDVVGNPAEAWTQFTFGEGRTPRQPADPKDTYELSATSPSGLTTISSSELNAIFDAKEAGQLQVLASVEFARFHFYDQMLQQFMRADTGVETFAVPGSTGESELQGSVMLAANGSVRHNLVTDWVRDIGVELDDWRITEAPSRQPQWSGPDLEPFAEVILELRFRVREAMVAGQRDTFARLAAASTFTSLYYASNGEGTQYAYMESAVRDWMDFLVRFLINYVDLSRGERVAQHIRTRATDVAGERTPSIIKALQLAIDERMVTANHWPDRREVEPEHHHRMMSLVLGDIHGHHVLGSPVVVLRDLTSTIRASDEQTAFQNAAASEDGSETAVQAAARLLRLAAAARQQESLRFVLALGVGHCGEHAEVSYTIVAQLIDTSPAMRAKLRNVIYSGRGNVDHAFVLVGVVADVVLSVRPRTVSERHGRRRRPGERVAVQVVGDRALFLDLAALHARASVHPLAVGDSDVGYFLDPYLDPSAHRETNDPHHPELNSTLRTLLSLIQHGVQEDLRTGTVYFGEQSPAPPPRVVLVLTGDNPANI